MIFYFSATGNSKYVANRVAEVMNDSVQIRMSKDEIETHSSYDVSNETSIGFVFPTYWYGIPTLVEQFLKHLVLEGYQNQYLYLIATYGIAGGQVLKLPKQLLQQKGYVVHGRFGVRLIDNYVIAYDVPSKEKQKLVIEQAEPRIQEILKRLQARKAGMLIDKGTLMLFSKPVHSCYKKKNHAKGFWVTNQCIGCGKCQQNCPTNAITIVEGKPVWNDKCTFCLGCIHQCPVQAVQYHKGTVKRSRYYNPMIKKQGE